VMLSTRRANRASRQSGVRESAAPGGGGAGGRAVLHVQLSDYGRSRAIIEHLVGKLEDERRMRSDSPERREDTNSRPYIAPELMSSGHHWGIAADIWSLGCLLARMGSSEPLQTRDEADPSVGPMATMLAALEQGHELPQPVVTVTEKCVKVSSHKRPTTQFLVRSLGRQRMLLQSEADNKPGGRQSMARQSMAPRQSMAQLRTSTASAPPVPVGLPAPVGHAPIQRPPLAGRNSGNSGSRVSAVHESPAGAPEPAPLPPPRDSVIRKLAAAGVPPPMEESSSRTTLSTGWGGLLKFVNRIVSSNPEQTADNRRNTNTEVRAAMLNTMDDLLSEALSEASVSNVSAKAGQSARLQALLREAMEAKSNEAGVAKSNESASTAAPSAAATMASPNEPLKSSQLNAAAQKGSDAKHGAARKMKDILAEAMSISTDSVREKLKRVMEQSVAEAKHDVPEKSTSLGRRVLGEKSMRPPRDPGLPETLNIYERESSMIKDARLRI